MKWISVKNEPMPNDEMIIVTNGEQTYVGELKPFDGWDFQIAYKFNSLANCFDLNAIMLNDITHWMLLPEPPIASADQQQ